METPSLRDLFAADEKTRLQPWEFSERLASRLYARVEKHRDFPHWPKPAQIFYACYNLIFQVGNGGFAQAAYNIPHLFDLAAEGYSALDLEHFAATIREISRALPKELRDHQSKGLQGHPTIDDVFAHFEESKLAAFDGVTSEASWWLGDNLNDFARQHRSEFLVLDSKEPL
jgi:hypothetical protein